MIQPTFPDSRRIKQYHAIWTQAATDDPAVTILHNTIGTIDWARTGVGIYTATSDGLFTIGKTIIDPWGGTNASLRIVFNPLGLTIISCMNIKPTDINIITVTNLTSTNSNTAREFSETGGSVLIKISVYE